MTNQGDRVRAEPAAFATAFPAVAERHATAMASLSAAFDGFLPLAVLAGEGRHETSHVLRCFLKSLDENVATVRINRVCTDILTGLGSITRALGFDASRLSVNDMHSILRLFLENQREHRRRTIIAVENVERQSDWLLDSLSRLVERETAERYGLTIVITGYPRSLGDRLACVASREFQRAARRNFVELASFSPAETSIFVRDRLRAANVGDVGRLFEFDAIARLHDIAAGVPDDVAALCCRCLVRANLEHRGRISEADVDVAADDLALLGGSRDIPLSLDDTINEEVDTMIVVRHRLVVRLDGNWLSDRLIATGSISIGRAPDSDVCLPNRYVSRRHAIVRVTGSGYELRDVGSRNGTYVGHRRIDRHALQADDVIRIGQFLIEYQQIAARPAAVDSALRTTG